MRLKKIYTDRYFEKWPSWQPVYEWEDVLSEQLGIRLTDSRETSIVFPFMDRALTSLSRRLGLKDKALLKLADKAISGNTSFCFEMYPRHSFRYAAGRHNIPCIIDFWKNQDLTLFYNVYSNCRLVLISSKEVFNWLILNNCPLNIRHFPLSIADKYKVTTSAETQKKYPIILPGRTSPVLDNYLQNYLTAHPEIEYLQTEHIDGQLHFKSNKTGVIGNFHKREDYMNLLKQCRIAFYSTPGIDGGEERTGGFNPVTPRLFEIAVSGCSVIARYPENADTVFYELAKYYPAVDSYEQFEVALTKALKATPEETHAINNAFIGDNFTSSRAVLLKEILSTLS